MRVTPFSRGLLVILALVAICTGGCARSQDPAFFNTSTPMQPDQVTSKRETPAQNAVIGIGPVTMADYLDQSDLVTRTSDNQLRKPSMIAGPGPSRMTSSISWPKISVFWCRPNGFISTPGAVRDHRLPGRPGSHSLRWPAGRGRLSGGAWRLFEGPDKKLLKMSRSSIREPVTGPDYSALVAAQSQAVAKPARRLPERLEQLRNTEASQLARQGS